MERESVEEWFGKGVWKEQSCESGVREVCRESRESGANERSGVALRKDGSATCEAPGTWTVAAEEPACVQWGATGRCVSEECEQRRTRGTR
ncbi:hypothetical protein L798_07197 [Zootermopsis nevadensis]|uniref:Uncharacterized protein n=1 Tax=Zootermopsis nevadensis TaxID=136037 RepID=A0A067R582_ZOONE|nr:hypothetical protein L798_07197 [Zootermopsis nevadensis]